MIDLIAIVCDEKSHNPGVKIAQAEPVSSGGWRLSRLGKGRYHFTELARGDGTVTMLNELGLGGTNRTVLGPTINRDNEANRARAQLRCPRCSLTVPMTEDSAVAVFDRLRHAGVDRITLSGLASILGSS